MKKINVKTDPSFAIHRAIGASIKAQVKENGRVSAFIDRTGISRSSLYRLFRGDVTEIQTLIEVLQGLGRSDILEQLVALPQAKEQEIKKSSFRPTRERLSKISDNGAALTVNASPQDIITLTKIQ